MAVIKKGKKSINLFLDPMVIEMLKADAAMEGRSMSEIVERLVRAYIKNNRDKILMYMDDLYKKELYKEGPNI